MDTERLATSAEIAHAAQAARAAGRLGIDTEFMSEGRYRALLCLVQVSVDGRAGSGSDPVDPTDPDPAHPPLILLIDSLTDVDVSPLAALLAEPSIQVVLHAGRQDVAILRRAWDTELTNIFDTQVAAGFAGGSAQSGYGNLLGAVLGLHVGKTASYTRWDTRPLTPEQLGYAAEDVVHLLALADEIRRRLELTGRLEWALEECRRLESATDERDPDTAWERLPRIGQLDPRARAVARELAAWRERTASEADRPVGSVARRPGARRAGQAQAILDLGPGADPRAAPAGDQAPWPGDHRRDRPGARRGADPARGGSRPLRARRRAVDRALGGRCCAPARSRPSWPTS